MNEFIETFEITEKEIDGDNIVSIFWSYEYSDSTIKSYVIAGRFMCEEHEISLQKNTSDEIILDIIKDKIKVDNFKQIVFLDLGK